jgi:branched-chain amino acid aminotransferase
VTLQERKIWLDGRLEPWDAATVHVLSQSIQRGSLVFDVIACYPTPEGPALFGGREHVDRFLRSAALNSMDLPLDREGLLQAISQTVRANPDAQVVKLSAYYPSFSLDVLPADLHPSIAIAAFHLTDVLPPGTKLRPSARLQLAATIKTPPRVLSPQVKIAAGYTAAATAKVRARREGFDDILFLNEKGEVAESSTQSFLVVRAGMILAPPTDYVLEGITRRAALELAEDEGIPIRIESIPRSMLEEAEEAFLTGTTLNVWAVEHVEPRKFPEPVPGPVTARLQARFDRMIQGRDPVFSPRWIQPI